MMMGVAAGLLCGPIMPLDVAAGTPQTVGAWTLRTMFFVLVAMVAAGSRARIVELGEAQQKLLSAVSHEARTPLAAVLGFSQLVQERYDELTAIEVREFVALINQEASELSNVIDHYVLEARLRHEMIVESVDVDIRHVVDVVLLGIPADVRHSRVVAAGEGVHVYGDPLRLRQVIRSLLNNALAYGGEFIVVDVRQVDGRGVVKIDDGRSGVVSAAQHGAAPLGVGLAVARELTEMMGGRLLYQVDGSGTFELHLPAVRNSARLGPIEGDRLPR